MRYIFMLFMALVSINCLAIEIGKQTKSHPAAEAKKLQDAELREQIAQSKLMDELWYSREHQKIREEKLYDRMNYVSFKFEMQYGTVPNNDYSPTRNGRVRGNSRVR